MCRGVLCHNVMRLYEGVWARLHGSIPVSTIYGRAKPATHFRICCTSKAWETFWIILVCVEDLLMSFTWCVSNLIVYIMLHYFTILYSSFTTLLPKTGTQIMLYSWLHGLVSASNWGRWCQWTHSQRQRSTASAERIQYAKQERRECQHKLGAQWRQWSQNTSKPSQPVLARSKKVVVWVVRWMCGASTTKCCHSFISKGGWET